MMSNTISTTQEKMPERRNLIFQPFPRTPTAQHRGLYTAATPSCEPYTKFAEKFLYTAAKRRTMPGGRRLHIHKHKKIPRSELNCPGRGISIYPYLDVYGKI